MKSDDIKMSKPSLVILGVFLILSAVPFKFQQIACTSPLTLCAPSPFSTTSLQDWRILNDPCAGIGIYQYYYQTLESFILHKQCLFKWLMVHQVTILTTSWSCSTIFLSRLISLVGLPIVNYDAVFEIFNSSSDCYL